MLLRNRSTRRSECGNAQAFTSLMNRVVGRRRSEALGWVSELAELTSPATNRQGQTVGPFIAEIPSL